MSRVYLDSCIVIYLRGPVRRLFARTDPWGPARGGERVLRGGSYGNSARRARSAFRVGFDPGVVFGNLGFRVVLPRP